jgi:RHS repeat-associated protein
LTLPNGTATEYLYDRASRISELIYRSALGSIGNLVYDYNSTGQQISTGGSLSRPALTKSVSQATYDAANHQLTFDNKQLTYDANGNLRSIAGTGSDATLLSWDARDRITSLSSAAGDTTFSYDAFGRRVSMSGAGRLTRYVYDADDIVSEDANGVSIGYLRTLFVDEAMVRGGREYYVADALGSTIALVNESGVITTEYMYDAFGSTSMSGVPSDNPFQFTGRENDGFGSYFYRSRFYDSGLQRFVSEDPAEFGGGDTNLYAYVSNDPRLYVDPFGLGKVGAVIKIVKRVGRFLQEGRTVSLKQAQNIRRRGGDVKASSERLAEKIERGAFKRDRTAGEMVRHGPHKEGYRPHFQTDKKAGHTFFGVAVVPGSGLGSTVGRKTGVPFLGSVVDFVNPMADIQDLLDLGRGL